MYLASREIPFAGHPTLAGVASLLHRGLVNGQMLMVETQAGIIPIEIGTNGHIIMTQISPVFGPVVEAQLVADALSLSVDDIIYPPQVVSTGLSFTVAVVRDHDALKRAVLRPDQLLKLQAEIDMPDTDVMEPFLVTLSGATSAGDTYARLLLAPPMPAEDPFTGFATGAMASYIWANGLIKNQASLRARPWFRTARSSYGHGVRSAAGYLWGKDCRASPHHYVGQIKPIMLYYRVMLRLTPCFQV